MQLEGFARKLDITVAAGIVDRETLHAAGVLVDAPKSGLRSVSSFRSLRNSCQTTSSGGSGSPGGTACVRWSFAARALSPSRRPLVDARADCRADAPWIRHADGDGLSGRGDDKSALRQ
jgi:hypothetical protein